ncbi:hypothetical protein [Azospirillum brasilense]|uniref:hypothetical protein n=1 Tax=Azospirillum brasilense TaxID=192 RepID=UPI001EDC41A9|nr:hypothetical protein [Azospirillum brasilense]UKJ74568.1 hypothetical protein H1Q64_18595 [Azospirillum brasilense]
MLKLRIVDEPGGFWFWLCRFSYRRVKAMGWEKIPVGLPGMRDPHAPCIAYAPRLRLKGEIGECLSDGHYQCADCAHLKRCPDCGERVSNCECDDNSRADATTREAL